MPSASACSSRGLCLNFISPMWRMAPVHLYILFFSSCVNPSTSKASYKSFQGGIKRPIVIEYKPLKDFERYADILRIGNIVLTSVILISSTSSIPSTVRAPWFMKENRAGSHSHNSLSGNKIKFYFKGYRW